MGQRKTIFVSYCHANKRWLTRLRVHLKPYERSGALDLWDDTMIDAGDQWRFKIDEAIARALASIVLISADFLASDFVAVHELPKLLRKAERARILPIVVDYCDLATHPELASFQTLNPPSKPLAAMPRAASEQVWKRAGEMVGKLLAEGPPPVPGNHGSVHKPSQSPVFEELQVAVVTLAILWGLSKEGALFTLSELEKQLEIRSRKRAHEAVERLVTEGWIEKSKIAGLTRFRLTKEGARQLQRLAAASDGPVRRATAVR